MMTNKRLEGLSKQLLSSFMKVGETPSEMYTALCQLGFKQKIYFENFEPSDFLKLSLMLYSLKSTGNFQLAYQIFEKLFFAVLYTDSGESYDEECEECGGDGRTSCDLCDGNGRTTCDECDGDGTVICNECDGEASVETPEGSEDCENCDGEGLVTCDNCDGDGTMICIECDGDGGIYCQECDGDGSINGESNYLEVLLICSWDDQLYNQCELKEGKPEPVISVEDFFNLESKMINLKKEMIGSLEFEMGDWVNDEYLYCFNVTDVPKLKLYSHGTNLKITSNELQSLAMYPDRLDKLLP